MRTISKPKGNLLLTVLHKWKIQVSAKRPCFVRSCGTYELLCCAVEALPQNETTKRRRVKKKVVEEPIATEVDPQATVTTPANGRTESSIEKLARKLQTTNVSNLIHSENTVFVA